MVSADSAAHRLKRFADLNLQFDGTEVAVGDVADLRVTVFSAEVEPASSEDQFPQWSNFTLLASITQGKPGGC